MLYGAQGANGVIQIFTKKGTKNRRASISLNSKVSIDNAILGNDLVATKHHYKTDAQGNILDQNGNILAPDANGQWPDPAEEDFNTNFELTNDKTYPATLPLYNHLKQAYRQAVSYNNSLNIAGGGEKSDYSFTFSRLDQQSVLSNNFTRINFKSTYPGTNLIVVRPRDENQLNVLSEPDWHTRTGKNTRIINNANLNYKFPKFVELDYKYGIEWWTSEFNDFYKNQEAAPQSGIAFWGPSVKGSLRRDYSKSIYQNSLATLYFRTDFQQDFGMKLPIKTSTQLSYDYRKLDYTSFFSQGLNLPQYPPFIISNAEQKVSGDGSLEYLTFGYFVNQTVDFGNLFGLTGGFRSDYNSEFCDQRKSIKFVSV